ncbi:MAG: phenylalanine--tRNA ligase beta subunit-related protein [Candidatus Eisenbacteria bacterium]
MTLQARAQGLALEVDDVLRGTLALGILEAEHIRLDPLPPAFDEECDRVSAQLVTAFAGKAPADIPGVAETRALFHRLNLDPTKTRPSSEALLRRVLQGKGLPRVNAAVDVCNLCSVEFQLPLGLYDRDQIKGGITARLGKPDEGYGGIRKHRVHLEGRLLLADQEGAFGAPTSDSARTSVSPRTKHLAVVVFCPVDRVGAHLSTALERLAALLTRYCSAGISAVRVAH